MATIRLDGVSFAYSDDVPLLADTHHVFDPGWTGLVGANGSGKTTLLRLIAGELEPQSGAVMRLPGDALLTLCPQRVDHCEPAIQGFANRWNGEACRLRGRLALDPEDLDRWPTLSPGERKRWQIAAALAAQPDVLLLDEPTNHLDGEGRTLLLQALATYRGVGIVVSHDRQVLSELTETTVRLQRGVIEAFPLAYAEARELWQGADRQLQEEYAKLRRQEKKVRRRLANTRRQYAASSRGVDRRVSPRDHDARSSNNRNRRRAAAKRLGNQVTTARRSLERIESKTAELEIHKAKGRSLAIRSEHASKSRLVSLVEPQLKAGERLLLSDLHLSVGRKSRIWIDGTNGSGKSTLLQALLGESQLPSERLLYLPQELSTQQVHSRLAALQALACDERGHILEIVAALGVDPGHLLATKNPSPGEARKLELAWGLGHRAWLLVLDEPTNHLDLPSIERLQTALEEYCGALVLVSHDRTLAATVTDETWCIQDGRLLPKPRAVSAVGS